MLPGRPWKPVLVEEIVGVGRQGEAIPVDDWFGDDGCPKTLCLPDDPSCEDASAATTRDKQIVFVDKALVQNIVDGRHQVVIILARVIVVDQIGKLSTVARTATRIDIQHDVSGGCE